MNKKKPFWRFLPLSILTFTIIGICIVFSEEENTMTTNDPATTTAIGTAEFRGIKEADAFIGNHLTFGTYEQDNNTENGKETIQWIVLDVKNGEALLISRFALDTKPYHQIYESITWEDCTLRA